MASVDDWIEMYERYIETAQNTDNPDRNRLEQAHSAAEALLKAVLTARGEEFPRTHDTTRLADDIPRFPDEKRSTLALLHSAYQRRYPDDLDTPEINVENTVNR